jgi:broad specificity phosphatase PhoE
MMELERRGNVLLVAHQAVLRCIMGYFLDRWPALCFMAQLGSRPIGQQIWPEFDALQWYRIAVHNTGHVLDNKSENSLYC